MSAIPVKGGRLHGAIHRSLVVLIAVVAFALGALLWWLRGPGPMDFAEGRPVELADYRAAEPTGAPVALRDADPVARGKYLTRAADCMVCHTARGGAPYAGGFAFNLPFGMLYSTNITPDKETGIGNYSDAQFLAALRRGVRSDGARLYPAMPFSSYTYMTDADALAIKAYLFSLAPVRAPATSDALSFPFNQRWLLGVWSWLFNADQRFRPNPAHSPEWNRGAYVSEALAHCGECHTPRNLAFALNNRKKYGGAVTAGWRAYNITSDAETGLGDWNDESTAAYLAHGHAAGHGTASGPMGEAVDESLSQLAPEDVRAVVTYLRSVRPVVAPDLPAIRQSPADASHHSGPLSADAQGKRVFEGACVSCHSWSGVSLISSLATLTGARAVNDPSARNIAQVVIGGASRTTLQGLIAMPPFGSTYSDAEIAAVANYVSGRFGSQSASLSEHDVAKFRRQVAQ
jgi:mono/diheme cytochrome c family protein